MNTSEMTAQDLKDRFVRNREDSRVSDQIIRDSLNDLYSVLWQYDRRNNPTKNRATHKFSYDSATGFDLNTIADIANKNDVRVYFGSIDRPNQLKRRVEGSYQTGFYFIGDTLFVIPSRDGDVVILYQKKAPRVKFFDLLVDHTLLVDQDLERAVLKYFEMVFFESQYQSDLENDARDKFMEEIERFYASSSSSSVL